MDISPKAINNLVRLRKEAGVDLPAKICFRDILGGKFERDGRLCGLGKNGAQVLHDEALPQGTSVELIIILESNDPFKGVATVFLGEIVSTEEFYHPEGNRKATIQFTRGY